MVFLALLVGVEREQKWRVVAYLARYMAAGARMGKRAHGAEPFMHPVADPCDLSGFQVLNVTHPQDELMINSVIARKCENEVHAHDNHSRAI